MMLILLDLSVLYVKNIQKVYCDRLDKNFIDKLS